VSDLEQRLRRDLKDFSQRVGPDSIRPLRVPPARRRSRAVRWLAPVAAVAGVIGVITGVSVVGPPAGKQPASAIAQPTGPMPRYYVTAFQTFAGNPNGGPSTFAAVHDSATGATLATVRVPTLTSHGGTGGLGITAAADDRTFLITQQPYPGVGTFYVLRVADDGRSAKLSKLPVSLPGSLTVSDQPALSPDGRRLAMDVQDCSNTSCKYAGIRVVTLATGAVSSWTTTANGSPASVSWVGNGQVAFEWQSNARVAPPGQPTGYRLLSLGGTGRDLLAAQAIGSPAPEPTQYMPTALVTSDGSIVVTSAVRNIPNGHGRYTVVAKIVELSARTGQLLRVLHTATVSDVSGGMNGIGVLDQQCNVLSLAPSGVHVLVACFAFGRVDGSRFTPLPGFPSSSSSGIEAQPAGSW
jgi:hypothetical protein